MSIETSIFVFDPAVVPRTPTLPKLLQLLEHARPADVTLAYEGYEPLSCYYSSAFGQWETSSQRWGALQDDEPASATKRLVDDNVISATEAEVLGAFEAALDFSFSDTGYERQRFAEQLETVLAALGLKSGSWKRLSDYSLVALPPADLQRLIVAARLMRRDLAENIATDHLPSSYRPVIDALARLPIDPSSLLLQVSA